MRDNYNCKYCNVKVVLLPSGTICCPSCGLVHKIIFDANKGINRVIALEGEEIKR
nr:MAG TPA: DNA-directed RNA polymerase II subunit [Caudoviricetes sp.]